MTTASKPNTGFWIIAVMALIWNLVGVFFWTAENFMMTDAILNQLPEAEADLFRSKPSWGVIVYGIATIGGTLAAILMLAKKKLAVPLFFLSLLCILIQMIYGWVATNAIEVYGTGQGAIMPLVIIIIGIFLYYYNKGAAQKGWLR